jgi:hypothetical protein
MRASARHHAGDALLLKAFRQMSILPNILGLCTLE